MQNIKHTTQGKALLKSRAHKRADGTEIIEILISEIIVIPLQKAPSANL